MIGQSVCPVMNPCAGGCRKRHELVILENLFCSVRRLFGEGLDLSVGVKSKGVESFSVREKNFLNGTSPTPFGDCYAVHDPRAVLEMPLFEEGFVVLKIIDAAVHGLESREHSVLNRLFDSVLGGENTVQNLPAGIEREIRELVPACGFKKKVDRDTGIDGSKRFYTGLSGENRRRIGGL